MDVNMATDNWNEWNTHCLVHFTSCILYVVALCYVDPNIPCDGWIMWSCVEFISLLLYMLWQYFIKNNNIYNDIPFIIVHIAFSVFYTTINSYIFDTIMSYILFIGVILFGENVVYTVYKQFMSVCLICGFIYVVYYVIVIVKVTSAIINICKFYNSNYVGLVRKSEKHGQGKEYYDSNLQIIKYNGNWENNKKNGTGILYDKDGDVAYSGEWKNGKKHGYGRFVVNDMTTYVGDFEKNDMKGFGRLSDGKKIYFGEFDKNELNGKGYMLEHSFTPLCYHGEFLHGRRTGNGTEYHKNEIFNNLLRGYDSPSREDLINIGELFGEQAQIKYTGEFVDGQYEGYGKQYTNNGVIIYAGNYVKGLYEGEGKLYNSSGILINEGTFNKGVFQNGITYVSDTKRQCIVCYDRDIEIVINKCGHCDLCSVCAHAIEKCPRCRIGYSPDTDILKIYH